MIAWLGASIRSAGWAPTLVFVTHVVASRVFGAYRVFPELDTPMHLIGGVAIAFFLWSSVNLDTARPILGSLSLTGKIVLTLAAVCTAAVIWEFAEWTTDHLGWTDAQLGLEDTLLDMLLGITGGVLFLIIAWRTSSDTRLAPSLGARTHQSGGS